MNFYIVRLLLIILMYILMVFLYKKNYTIKNVNKLFKYSFIIFIILVFIIKPEKIFLKFDNLESAFKYSFPTKKILYTVESDDYGFVVYQKNEIKDVIYFKKSNNKWMFSSISTIYRYKYIGSNIVTIKNIKNTDNYFLYVDLKSSDNNDIEIIDSLGNKYIECIVNGKHNYYYYIKNMPSNYYILVNNKKVKIN